MRIVGAYLRDLEPFADQPVPFPEKQQQGLAEVHFFVGQNGTGKTRLLSLLAAACGNTTELNYRAKIFTSFVAVANANSDIVAAPPQTVPVKKEHLIESGKLRQLLSDIAKHSNQPGMSQLRMLGQGEIGLAFRSIPMLEDQSITPMGPVKFGHPLTYLTFMHHQGESQAICQGMANIKVRMGIVSNDPTDRTVRMVHAFDRAITTITGRPLILTVGNIKEFRLRAKWGDHEMELKQLPDGLRSILGWLASCLVKLDILYPDDDNPLEKPIILLLDEPDAHLHPAWQRKLIPAVQQLLPNAQIFIATHSPFVISSVNHGWIHIFKADSKGVVTIEEPRPCHAGDSYRDVVEDILGVQEQFDPETEEMLSLFRSKREAAKAKPTDAEAANEVRTLAAEIASRGDTLRFMMEREIAQFDYQLKQSKA